MEDDSRNGSALSVVTSFGPVGHGVYGRRFIETFNEFWPKSVRLIVYWEGDERPDGVKHGHDLLSLEPAASFIKRHDNLIMRGLSPHHNHPWGRKATSYGYNFRYDAFKFSRKVFAVAHAARKQKTGRLFWIDADVVTHARVEKGFLLQLLPDKISLSYLERPGYHSELGFVGYNLTHPHTLPFIEEYERQYADDVFIGHDCWDDCNIFDMLVRRMRPDKKTIKNSSRAQPFDSSMLSLYMHHNKGKRKDL